MKIPKKILQIDLDIAIDSVMEHGWSPRTCILAQAVIRGNPEANGDDISDGVKATFALSVPRDIMNTFDDITAYAKFDTDDQWNRMAMLKAMLPMDCQ